MRKSFYDLFGDSKALIGMIHLAGRSDDERVNRALRELNIFEEEGFNGAIIEDYEGSSYDVERTLIALKNRESKLVIGVNVLGNEGKSFRFAKKYNADFIQIDSLHSADIALTDYQDLRKKYPNIPVFGGINFKYKTQEKGKNLERELQGAMKSCEAIVTTGKGTGKETPIENLKEMREIIGRDFPLIAGAGVDSNNLSPTLEVADGIIIGSYLKCRNTKNPILIDRVRKIGKK